MPLSILYLRSQSWLLLVSQMIELAERSRQMNKGKAKRGVATVQVDES